jgi:hypothetical protein
MQQTITPNHFKPSLESKVDEPDPPYSETTESTGSPLILKLLASGECYSTCCP